MQGLDGFLHVRPFLEDSDYRGFAMFFNPTNEIIKEMAEIPLYTQVYRPKQQLFWKEIGPLSKNIN